MAVFSATSMVPGTQWTYNIFFGNILNVHCYLNISMLVWEHGEEYTGKIQN